MTPFTVVGYWLDTMQRFSTWIEASSPEQAEDACILQHPMLAVCGVLAGHHECADTGGYVRCGSD